MVDISDRIKKAMDLRAIGFNELDRKLGRSEGYTSRTLSKSRRPNPRHRSPSHARSSDGRTCGPSIPDGSPGTAP